MRLYTVNEIYTFLKYHDTFSLNIIKGDTTILYRIYLNKDGTIDDRRNNDKDRSFNVYLCWETFRNDITQSYLNTNTYTISTLKQMRNAFENTNSHFYEIAVELTLQINTWINREHNANWNILLYSENTNCELKFNNMDKAKNAWMDIKSLSMNVSIYAILKNNNNIIDEIGVKHENIY